ncbi:MAG: polyisoprenoid-binding protein [Candidatus Omnitrophica bacterium]|nr:polyisoprenoid-binding protein [Candidatus Omnitrophota bacterium]
MVFSLLIAPAVFAADTYTIDPAHTTFGFTVKHMMISNVPGNFDKFEGQITYSPADLNNAKANITIDVSSINTRIDKRDAHLKSPDFFDAEKFPKITFVSTKFTSSAITGHLTMKGVTREVTIPVTISGPVKTMMGSQAIGITGSVTVNRQDYGINWNKILDQGGVAVSNDVLVNISIEADQK